MRYYIVASNRNRNARNECSAIWEISMQDVWVTCRVTVREAIVVELNPKLALVYLYSACRSVIYLEYLRFAENEHDAYCINYTQRFVTYFSYNNGFHTSDVNGIWFRVCQFYESPEHCVRYITTW